MKGIKEWDISESKGGTVQDGKPGCLPSTSGPHCQPTQAAGAIGVDQGFMSGAIVSATLPPGVVVKMT